MENSYDLKNYFYHSQDNIRRKELVPSRLKNPDLSKTKKFTFYIEDVKRKILLSESFVKLKFKILKENGDSIGIENVTGVNGLNPFKGAKLTINSTVIEYVDSYLDILQNVKKLIEYTPEYLTSQPTDMFVFLDTNDTNDRKKFILQDDGTITAQTPITGITNKLNVIENVNYNEGFDKRCQLTENSRSNSIMIPLDQIFDFISAYPKILTGVSIEIEFERNSDENMLYTSENHNYKVVFEDLCLILTRIELKNDAETLYATSLLSDKSVDILWNHYEIYRTNTIDKHKSGQLYIPTRSNEVLTLIAIPQYLDRSDNYKENNMIFDNLDMVECWYEINGDLNPSDHYKMDEGEWNRPFEELLRKLIVNKNTETAPLINYLNFAKLYPLIVFDLSNHEDYDSVGNITLNFHYRLKNQTNKEYIFYFITEVRKRTQWNIKKQEFKMISSLII